jgi:hypothetical protein
VRLRRITWVWLGLLGATALSSQLGRGSFLGDPRNAGAAILLIAFVKIRFVILDFMELRHAPLGMRVAGEAWVIGAAALLIALYRF